MSGSASVGGFWPGL